MKCYEKLNFLNFKEFTYINRENLESFIYTTSMHAKISIFEKKSLQNLTEIQLNNLFKTYRVYFDCDYELYNLKYE